MQEVFEKIIKKLEHLHNNFVEHCEEWGEDKNGDCHHKSCSDCVLNHAIEIVNQVAAEYNNGWIPCSERLPEEPKINPLFEGKNLELYLVTTEYGSNDQDKVYPFRAFWNGVNFTDGWHILDVIAWQPLQEPYQQNGEYHERKITNADRIRSMSDEELAEFLERFGSFNQPCSINKGEPLKWLQSEVEE